MGRLLIRSFTALFPDLAHPVRGTAQGRISQGRCPRRRIGLAVVGLLGGLLLGGCGGRLPEANDLDRTEPAPVSRQDLDVLRLVYSRSTTILNPHLATGYQDFEAARIAYEPLATYDADGELIPVLAATIPTIDNGDLAEDGTRVTWRLQPGLTWADGTPLTAEDVVFTYEFVSNPAVAAATAAFYEGIEQVEALDDTTVEITFSAPTPAWATPFTGQTGILLPRHIFEPHNNSDAREAAANFRSVGTGPYQVETFSRGQVVFEPNPNYRGDPPAFRQVELVGGVIPYTAARQVLALGEADFAHNLQVEAPVLDQLAEADLGRVEVTFGGYVERLMLNFADPNQETADGERASLDFPHPFLSDPRVRQAIDLAIDRDRIATDLYGPLGLPTAHLLVAPEHYAPIPVEPVYDPEGAAALLDQAGWVDTTGDGVRDRNGMEMQVVFQTSVNPVRQATQAIIRENLAAIGIEVDIRRVRIDDFFGATPDQTTSINHFYADLQAYNAGNDSPDPGPYLKWWLCDEIATQANNWQRPNNARYCNPTYDELWLAASTELDSARRAELFRQMDDLLRQDVAVVPLVHRATANAVSHTLTGLTPTPWDASTWDIHRWQRGEAAAAAPSEDGD